MYEEPLLDFQAIEKLQIVTAKRGPDFWISLIENFLTHTATLIDELKQFHKQGNQEQVNKIAHKLKGTVASFGALALAQVCKEIENHKQDKTKIDILIKQLDECYLNTQIQLLNLTKNTEK